MTMLRGLALALESIYLGAKIDRSCHCLIFLVVLSSRDGLGSEE